MDQVYGDRVHGARNKLIGREERENESKWREGAWKGDTNQHRGKRDRGERSGERKRERGGGLEMNACKN